MVIFKAFLTFQACKKQANNIVQHIYTVCIKREATAIGIHNKKTVVR